MTEDAHALHGRRLTLGSRRCAIPVADPDPADHFASHLKGPCVDLAGAHWPGHDYDALTGRCRRCKQEGGA